MFNGLNRKKNQQAATETPDIGGDDKAKVSLINAEDIKADDTRERNEPPEIPENVFIEYEKPKQINHMEPAETKPEVNDLQSLYKFLEQNFEKKGYEDALMNPDTSSMDEQVRFIQNDLNLMISKVKTYYSGYTRTINFHIDTRKRNGMVETVDELLTHKATVEEEIKIVQTIEEDSRQGKGLSENLILSYKRGFKNGFAAITYNNILSRKNHGA